MMRLLQMLGVIVVSVIFLATPSVADHHKKGGNKAEAGKKGTTGISLVTHPTMTAIANQRRWCRPKLLSACFLRPTGK